MAGADATAQAGAASTTPATTTQAGVDACALDELTEGVPHLVTLGSRRLVIALWRGEVFAVRDVCPHQTQSFECGAVVGRLIGAVTPGEVALDVTDPVVRCPWHTWDFRLADGRCTRDPNLRIATYPASVVDGRVRVQLGPIRSSAAAAPDTRSGSDSRG